MRLILAVLILTIAPGCVITRPSVTIQHEDITIRVDFDLEKGNSSAKHFSCGCGGFVVGGNVLLVAG